MSDESSMTLAEQLSAFMDGQLPEEQARFLRRQLEHDDALRAAWSRLHLASSCLKGHAVAPLVLDCAAVRAAERDPAGGVAGRSGWMRWAVAASVAVLAVTLAPRLVQAPAAPTAVQAPALATAGVAVTRDSPSPSTADLVAFRPMSPPPAAVDSAPAEPSSATRLVAESESGPTSPLPQEAQSPADFPLADTGEKSWPRSEVPGVGNDPQLEAYLVRHNQMLANGGLGGFVPYLDVVARDPARSAVDVEPAAQATPEPATK